MRTIKIAIILFFLMTGQAYAYYGEMLVFVTPQSVEFSLEDPVGHISGYTYNGVISQIPNMKYDKTAEISSEDVQPESEKFNSLEPTTIPTNYINGKYKIKMYGNIMPTNTDISIKLVWDSNVQPWSIAYRDFKLIYPNIIWVYEFDVPAIPTNDGQITLIKVSTPADFIKDIRTAGQLGYIGNPKFVKDLAERVAQVALLKGDQKKGYEDILSELTSLYNKPEQDRFIKKEGYDVLKEDLDYIISHL